MARLAELLGGKVITGGVVVPASRTSKINLVGFRALHKQTGRTSRKQAGNYGHACTGHVHAVPDDSNADHNTEAHRYDIPAFHRTDLPEESADNQREYDKGNIVHRQNRLLRPIARQCRCHKHLPSRDLGETAGRTNRKRVFRLGILLYRL